MLAGREPRFAGWQTNSMCFGMLGGIDTSALARWLGNEACGLVCLLIMNDALLGKHRSIWGAETPLLWYAGWAMKHVVW